MRNGTKRDSSECVKRCVNIEYNRLQSVYFIIWPDGVVSAVNATVFSQNR